MYFSKKTVKEDDYCHEIRTFFGNLALNFSRKYMKVNEIQRMTIFLNLKIKSKNKHFNFLF